MLTVLVMIKFNFVWKSNFTHVANQGGRKHCSTVARGREENSGEGRKEGRKEGSEKEPELELGSG